MESQLRAIAESRQRIASVGDSKRTGLGDTDYDSSAGITKRITAMTKVKKANTELLAATTDLGKKLLSLEQKRITIFTDYQKAVKSGNRELIEHYGKQRKALSDHVAFLEDSIALNQQQKKISAQLHDLDEKRNQATAKGRDLTATQLGLQTDLIRQNESINELLEMRSLIEAESAKHSITLQEAEEQVTKNLQKQIDLREQVNARQAKLDAMIDEHMGIRNEGDKDELNWMQRIVVGSVGAAAGIFTLTKAWEALKGAGNELVIASDAVAEAQYQIGTSITANSSSLSDYAKKTVEVSTLTNTLGIEFARMGLNYEEANEIIPKLVAQSSQAAQALRDGNLNLLVQMSKDVGAFSRLTGMSIDEAASFQSDLINKRNMTAQQASEEMTNITGDIRGLNDLLVSAGYKGALLNVTTYANLAKEAAANTDEMTINTEAYTKQLVKAAAASTQLGMSDEQRTRMATKLAQLKTQKDPFRDFQKGELLAKRLESDFQEQIKSKDMNAIVQQLMKNPAYGMQDQVKATTMAAMLISGKQNNILYEQRMADMARGSTVFSSVDDERNAAFMKEILQESGAKTQQEVITALMNKGVAQATKIGLDIKDSETPKALMTIYQKALTEGRISGPSLAAQDENGKTIEIDEKKIEEAITKGQENAKAENLADNAMPSLQRMRQTAGAVMHTFTGQLLTGLGLAAGTGIAFRNRKAIASKSKSLLRWLGGETAEATEKAVAEKAESGAMKRIGSGVLRGVMHSKWGKILGGAAALGGVGYAGYKMFGDESGETNPEAKPTEPTTTQPAETEAPQLDTANTNAVSENTKAINDLTEAFKTGAPVGSTKRIGPGYGINQPTQQEPTYDRSATGKAVNAGMNVAADYGMHYAGIGAGKLATKLAPSITSKLTSGLAAKTAAKIGGELAAKSTARAVPLIGPLISGAMTYAMTDGPIGRKIAASVGDVAGTLGGQFVTGGFGGGVVGGAAGQFGATELYDKLTDPDSMFGWFSDRENASRPAPVAVPQSVLDKAQTPAGTSTTGSAPAPTIAAITPGGFGNVGLDGSTDLTLRVRVAGFANAVGQASTLNQAQQSQFSGRKVRA
jgi:hypothetical protein